MTATRTRARGYARDGRSRRLCNAIIDSGGVQRRRKEQHRFAVLVPAYIYTTHIHIDAYTTRIHTHTHTHHVDPTTALRAKCQTPLTRRRSERAPRTVSRRESAARSERDHEVLARAR